MPKKIPKTVTASAPAGGFAFALEPVQLLQPAVFDFAYNGRGYFITMIDGVNSCAPVDREVRNGTPSEAAEEFMKIMRAYISSRRINVSVGTHNAVQVYGPHHDVLEIRDEINGLGIEEIIKGYSGTPATPELVGSEAR